MMDALAANPHIPSNAAVQCPYLSKLLPRLEPFVHAAEEHTKLLTNCDGFAALLDGDTRVELGNASNVSVSQGAETFRAECKSWGFKSVELQHAFVSEGAPAHLLHVLGYKTCPMSGETVRKHIMLKGRVKGPLENGAAIAGPPGPPPLHEAKLTSLEVVQGSCEGNHQLAGGKAADVPHVALAQQLVRHWHSQECAALGELLADEVRLELAEDKHHGGHGRGRRLHEGDHPHEHPHDDFHHRMHEHHHDHWMGRDGEDHHHHHHHDDDDHHHHHDHHHDHWMGMEFFGAPPPPPPPHGPPPPLRNDAPVVTGKGDVVAVCEKMGKKMAWIEKLSFFDLLAAAHSTDGATRNRTTVILGKASEVVFSPGKVRHSTVALDLDVNAAGKITRVAHYDVDAKALVTKYGDFYRFGPPPPPPSPPHPPMGEMHALRGKIGLAKLPAAAAKEAEDIVVGQLSHKAMGPENVLLIPKPAEDVPEPTPQEKKSEKKEMKDWAGVKDWKKEDWSWKKKVDWAKFGAAKKGCMGRMEALKSKEVAKDSEEFQALIRSCAEEFAGLDVPKEMAFDWAQEMAKYVYGPKEDWSWKEKVDWEKFGAAKKGCMGRMEALKSKEVAKDSEEFQALIRSCAEEFAGLDVPNEMAFDWAQEMAKYVNGEKEDWSWKESVDWTKVKGIATYAETYFTKEYSAQDAEAREKMHFGVTERLKHAGLPAEKAEGMWRDWAQKASP